MSQHDEKVFDDGALDALFDAARNEQPPRPWTRRRELFRHLALGGIVMLLLVRARAAFANLPRALRATLAAIAVGAVMAGALLFVGPTPHANEPVRASENMAEQPALVVPPTGPAHESETPGPIVSVDELPSVAPPPARSAPPREPRGRADRENSPALDDSLARETRSIAKIRGLVAASDFPGALVAVAEHRVGFPDGLLGQEATVLEIEALQGAHDPRGCRAGRTFLDAHPGSAHRTRVMSLLRSCGE